MAIIVNPAWKSKKEGDIVKFKKEEYEIGSTAFGSIQDAVAAGNTSDLVIVDKKLTSPVKVKGEETPKAITGAATDIFTADVKETKSKDEKTQTKTIKFSATAGGTASIKDTEATLAGFDKITAKNAGGVFQGGKQDIAYSSKTVSDSDKGIENADETVSRASKATGSLQVTGKDNGNRANVAVAGITDADMPTEPADAVKKTFKAITGEEYDSADFITATYASVNLKFANTSTGINGGNLTEKAVFKTTSTNSGEKTTENYSYTATIKAGSGTASVVDSNIGAITGFKVVTISAKTAASPMTVAGKIDSGSGTKTLTLKTAYTAGKSYNYDYTENSTNPAGKGNTLTIKGLADSKITVNDEINDFDTVTLTNAVINKAMESNSKTEKETVKIAVKDQKGVNALTFNGTEEENKVVGGKSLTATDTTFSQGVKGFGSITFKQGVAVLGGAWAFDAETSKEKTTKKQSGTAVEGLTDDKTKYVWTMNPVLDATLVSSDEAYTLDYTDKDEKNVGGTKFSASGAAGAYTGTAVIKGFKTVELNNTHDTNVLSATLVNQSYVSDNSTKASFTPEKAYSFTTKSNDTSKALGSATLKGKNITVGNISGFATIKVNGTDASMKLNNVTGAATFKSTTTSSETIKAGKGNPIGNYTYSDTTSSKLATELDATKVTLSGSYDELKKAKLTEAAGTAIFTNTVDYDDKGSGKVTWNAEDILSTELVPVNFYDDPVTSWDEKFDSKQTIVGEFTLKNTTAAVTALQVNNYKKADITLAAGNADVNFANAGDSTQKKAVKRTVTATKRTQNYSDSTSQTATGSLKITGNSTTPNTLTITTPIAYSSIELKDAKITGSAANAYSTTTATTATETATLDSGDVTAVTLKYSFTSNTTGNGSFKASVTNNAAAFAAFAGDLNGYGTIELKDTAITMGNADNRKFIGNGPAQQVVWNTDYFDVIAVNNGKGGTPGTALAGNITGSYTLDKKGQIDSKWTGYTATLSSGTFTQKAAIDNVQAGSITGYDKVTLNRIKTVGAVDGTNTETTRVLTYKVGKDEEVTANSDVTTAEITSSSSISVTGTDGQASTVASITGYKTVELTDASVTGTVTAKNIVTVTTIDKLAYNSTETLDTADGKLTAEDTTLNGKVDGFKDVELTDTTANVIFDGGTSYSLRNDTAAKDLDKEEIAAGSFTATTSNATSKVVGTVTGFQNVTLTDYNSGAVAVKFAQTDAEYKATSFEFTPADAEKETSDSWEKAAATKNNNFTATVDKATDMAVAAIDGYNKVTVTGGVTTVAAITNAFITDKTAAFDRIYGAKHYGNWTASAEKTETAYTKIDVVKGGDVKITGVKDGTQTAVTGDIAGYNNITLDYVKVGSAGKTATYAGGSYTYSTTTNKDDVVTTTSKNTAAGKLAITNAQSAAADAAFKVEGFQNVDINLTALNTKATFESIIGGTEEATFIGGSLNTVKYTVGGTLSLTVAKDSASVVTDKVAGFSTMNFNDVNFSGAGDKIIAYSIPSKDKKSVAAAVTFDNNKDGANTIASNIAGAKTVTFKSSTADASDDFTVTGKIESNKASAGTKIDGNTTVTFDKAQVSMAFANFDLDAGDVLNFVSGTGAENLATLNLGAIDAALTADVWKDVSLTGTGTVKFSGSAYGDADAFKTALKTVAKATVADTITFQKG